MGDVRKTGCSLSLIDLTTDNASSSNHTVPYIDITESDDGGTNHSPDIIDLTADDNQHFTSNIPVIDLTGDNDQFLNYRIPVIDLTGDNDQFLNYRIPVIDLTDDDVQDITHQTQCIDLTVNNVSSGIHTIRNFNLGEIDDRVTNCNTKLIDLTHGDIQDFNPNIPVTDLSCDNDQFLNYRNQEFDMTDADVQDITHQLQSFDMTDSKQQSINDCISTIHLKSPGYQNIDRIVPVTHLTSYKDGNNDKPVIDSIGNDDCVFRKPVDDVEMLDLSFNNSPTSFLKDVMENNSGIPAANLSYKATENDFKKCNENADMNVMHIRTFSTMQKSNHRREILANHPLENNHEIGKETILMNRPLRNEFEDRIETIFTNHLRNNSGGRKETISSNHSQTNNFEENYSSTGESEKTFENDAFDLMKPARYPIPLRHSLGRSTVNTSKNIPIEYTEASEDQSRILTVSSIIRRKKLKSTPDISWNNLPKSKKLSTSRENTISFETFKGFYWKLWMFFLLAFMGLYYWL